MDDLTEWIRAHAANAEGSGRDLQMALMEDDPDQYERFRYVVLVRCLVHRLEQSESDVRQLLRQEVLGEETAAHVPPATADEDVDEMPSFVVELAAPEITLRPADFVQCAIERLDAGLVWHNIAAHQPTHPVGFAAKLLAWRVRDQLFRSHERPPIRRTHTDRAHHVASEQLDYLREAEQREWAGAAAPLQHTGVYDDLLAQIRDHLDAQSGTSGVSYAMRKLFPSHAWPLGGAPGPLRPWLEVRLRALWDDSDAWEVFVRDPPRPWSAGRPESLTAALDDLARSLLTADAVPSWPEVAGWIRERGTPENTLSRRVSRLDREVRAIIDRALETLRRDLREG